MVKLRRRTFITSSVVIGLAGCSRVNKSDISILLTNWHDEAHRVKITITEGSSTLYDEEHEIDPDSQITIEPGISARNTEIAAILDDNSVEASYSQSQIECDEFVYSIRVGNQGRLHMSEQNPCN